MISIPDVNAEDKLLYNGLLFCELRLHEKIDDKLANLEKFLTEGGDVNTHDANDCNNTPLHVAVKKDEPEIIEFLLHKGANPNAINTNNHTPIDLAKICQNTNKNKIIQIIKKTTKSLLHLNEAGLLKNESLDISSKLNNEQSLINETRSGTTGISGHLYESKLLALLLLRALNDHDIDTFYLGSNIQGLGAFDDIVFKYYSKNKNKFSIVFVQAKHKDVGKFTTDSVLSFDKDFGLANYFDSFMKVIYKMKQKNYNVMFKNDVNSSDLRFLLYTTAIEDFNKKKLIKTIDKEALLSTSYHGKVFMYDYNDNDVDILLKNILILRAKSLAKVFAEYIIRKKYENMLLDELIQVYHVYLSQKVVHVFNGKSEDYVMGRFRKGFIDSKDETLLLIRNIMFKIMKIQNESECEILDFKLPKNFGNSVLPISEEEYVSQWNVIQCFMNNEEKASLDNIITIAVNDECNKTDLNHLKYLVGDTLILDDKTGLLKLNLVEPSSEKNKKIIDKLKLNVKTESDLSKFRFEINLQSFPQLLFRKGSYLKKSLTDFLNKLQLHTNQAKEEEVEEILISEIISSYNNEHKNYNNFYHIKGEAIYLDYHDRVQKWCKNKTKKFYMTKTCNFYEKAKYSLLNSPLLKVYNYIYISNINSLMLHFDTKAIEELRLQEFMDCSNTGVLNIITRDKVLTSLKIKQFFKENYPKPLTFNFLNLEALSEDDSEVILSEIFDTKMDVVVFILSGDGQLNDFEIKLLERQYDKKVIVITPLNISAQVFETKAKGLKLYDESISLCNFDETTRNTIISQKCISFQGFQVSLDSLIGENNYNLVKGDVLYTIIKKGAISIAKEPTNIETYDETSQFFVNRRLCRCLKLIEKPYHTAFNVIDSNNASIANNNKDILIISNDDNVFIVNCEKYCDKNIHWFQSSSHIWVKSHGSIRRILPFLDRIECDENGKCSREIQSFKHVSEKVVIISAGAGMGKSTLIAHLIKQTRQSDETITCIIKLNLFDLKNEFGAQHECNDYLKLSWFLSILYKSFAINDTSFLNTVNNGESFDNVTSVDGNKQIHLNTSVMNTIHERSLLEFQVFLNMYNNDKITIVFDGFDEIYPDYKKEAIELFQLLLNSRIKCMWITTRPVILKELERVVNSVSFTLKGFSANEQISFLEKYWMTNSSQTSEIRNRDLVVTQFLDAISHKIMDRQKYFTSIPLHLRMIAETFLEYYINFRNNPTAKFKDDLYDALNLVTLYDKFINVKFYGIRFSEKQYGLSLKDPDMKEVIEQQRILFIRNHKKLSAYTLLHRIKHQNPKLQFSAEKNSRLVRLCSDHTGRMVTEGNGVLTKNDLKHIRILMQRLKSGGEKNGIIERINQNEPVFVHLTYAEYFANEFLCDKLKYNDSTIMFLIDRVLVMDNNEGIRRFFDAKLEKDKSLSNFNSKIISDNLLRQKDSDKSALYLAVIEGRDNIACFLLNNISTILQADNIDDFIALVTKKYHLCTLCQTLYNNSYRVLKKIIDVISQVDCYKLERLFFCKDDSGNNIFTQILLRGDTKFHELSNMDIVIQYTNPEIFIKLLVKTKTKMFSAVNRLLIHYLVEDLSNVLYLKYIEKLNQKQCMRVFCARDKMQRIPAHKAAFYNNFDFFEMMFNRVGKEKFKKICTLRDKYGEIPLQCFISLPFGLDKFKLLCAKVDIIIGPLDGGGWFLYDIANTKVIATTVHTSQTKLD